jgi:hypothetical protein
MVRSFEESEVTEEIIDKEHRNLCAESDYSLKAAFRGGYSAPAE